MARRRPNGRLDRNRHPRTVSGQRPEGALADARPRRLRRTGRGRRARVRGRRTAFAREHGGGGARRGARRGDRRGAVDPRVDHRLHRPDLYLGGRSAGDAHRGRRPRLRARRRRHPLLPGRRDRRRHLAQGLQGRLRRRAAGLGHGRRAAGGGRPAHLPGRRGSRRQAGRVRQAHRRRGVAGAGVRFRAGLLGADRHRSGRRAAAHPLAPRGGSLAEPGHRRGVLGAAGPRRLRDERRHAGAERPAAVRFVVLQRRPDARPRPGPAGLVRVVEEHQRQRADDRGAPRGDQHAGDPGRLHLRHRQLRPTPRARCPHRRAPVGDAGSDAGARALGLGLHRAQRRPLFHQQRPRRADHRPLQSGGV